ncbi:hypothetical protein EZV62_012729 [Acer yangbiense]|uniref:CCHC-type domain-containing protein n=1 Tax=Acer yangbiense TaxID=1000413 RepID=A0A5C7HYG1_9ROSI|nr:hypothetical protein EZV62_012729 [Acer yangbiense]
MVESEIEKLYEKLSLADEDGAVHEMVEEDQRDEEVEVELCLVGKVLSGKKVNRDAFKNLIEQLWSPFGRVEVKSVGVNIFMFHFRKHEEWSKIWQRGPWYFDKSLLVLEKPEGMGNISQLRFDKVELWIQIHDVPIICMNRRTAKWMAEQLGRVIDLLSETNEYNIVMVGLKYERLPEFCYVCGRIGHASKDCSDVEAKSEDLKSDFTKYGSWMRASIPERQKLRLDQQIEGNSKVPSGVMVERSGQKEVGLGKNGNGDLSLQAVEQTDIAKEKKEADSGSQKKKNLTTDSGLGSSQGNGLSLKGPSEEAQLNNKKNVVEGNESSGSGLKEIEAPVSKLGPVIKLNGPMEANEYIKDMAMVCSSQSACPVFPKQSIPRNWKRMAREKKNELNPIQQPSLFRKLQTVNTKGKKNSKGNAYSSTISNSSRDRGTLASSLKHWDVKFGKRKLVIGSGVENCFHTSDHRPILLKFDKFSRQLKSRYSGFRFEPFWLKEEDIGRVVMDFWKGKSLLNSTQEFLCKLNQCATSLVGWSRDRFKNLSNQIEVKNREIECLYKNSEKDGVMTVIRELEKSVEELLDSEEIFWKQRSRVEWLEAGDRNSKFLHARATARKKKNTIQRLLNSEGRYEDTAEGKPPELVKSGVAWIG